VPRRKPHALSEAKLAKALAEVPEVVRVWLALAAFAGLRASEIAGLRRENILDGQRQPAIWVTWETAKGQKERTVRLSAGLWRILCDYGLPRRGLLFLRADGRPETGKHVSATCNRWLHRLGIEEHLHQARHRFASRSLDGGARLHVLQEWLGHDSLATTQVYLEVTVSDVDAAAIERIDHPMLEE
jgi:integrase